MPLISEEDQGAWPERTLAGVVELVMACYWFSVCDPVLKTGNQGARLVLLISYFRH